MVREQFLYAERYRPETIDDCILPQFIKDELNKYVDQKNIPNLLMIGRSGVGKTTAARALIRQLGADSMLVNCSLEGNMDKLRNDITNFATTVSFSGKRKFCILDEIDSTSPQFQPALRTFMEQYSSNCGFILTANHINKVLKALQSRCSVINFRFPNGEKVKLITDFSKRILKILKKEKVDYDVRVVGQLVQKFYPDFRRCLNELQRYKKIDSGALANIELGAALSDLIKLIKNKDFTGARKWIGEHSDIEPTELFSAFYHNGAKYFEQQSIAQLIVLLGEYQYKSILVVDQEINTAAFIVEVMAACSVK